MTVLDDRAEALADQLHNASVAATQLADARDQAQAGPSAMGQVAPRDSGAPEPMPQQLHPRMAADTTTSERCYCHAARELRQAMRLITEGREEILADVHLTLLRIVYQEFRFTVELRQTGQRRWVAARRNIAAGLYAVVTDDLDELLAVLGPADLSRQPCTEMQSIRGAAEKSGYRSEEW